MSSLTLDPKIKEEISSIARAYGFKEIGFDTEFPFEGFRRYLANSKNSEQITYRYLFLSLANDFYNIHPLLLQKTTRVLTLHEWAHHQPPFDSKSDADEIMVQKRACEEYGNIVEAMFLDVLMCQYQRASIVSEEENKMEVAGHLEEVYPWIYTEKAMTIASDLSLRKNYKTRNLRRILIRREIIPEHSLLEKVLALKTQS